MGTGIRLQVLKPHRAGMTEKVHDQLTFSVIWDQAAGKARAEFRQRMPFTHCRPFIAA